MSQVPIALTGVPTRELEQLLRYLHHGQIEAPLGPAALALTGFQHRSEELMQTLRGLESAGVRAVLVAVLAERQAAERRP